MEPGAHEAAAAAAAAAAGEPWPPERTPCDACVESDKVGDIEDAGGADVSKKPPETQKRSGAVDGARNVSTNVSALERTFKATAAAGAVGIVASMCWMALERGS